jgi:hypothetical protein
VNVVSFVIRSLEVSKKKKREMRYSDAKKIAEQMETGGTKALNLPSGLEFFNPEKPGLYRLNIIPFEAKKGNPNCDPGFMHYERTFWVHRNVGVNRDTYVCPAKTINKPCPICEHRGEMMKRKDSDKDIANSLVAKQRQLFYVQNVGDDEEDIKLWEVSFHNFGKKLNEKVRYDDEEGTANFYHLDGGSVLKVTLSEKSYEGTKFLEASNVEMKPRKKDLDEDILGDLPPLDDLIRIEPYDKLKAVFLQYDEDEDEDEDDEPKKKKSKAKSKPSDDEDEEDEEDEDEDEDEDDDEDDEPKKSKSKAKSKSSKSKKSKDDDEDDDEDDEDDDEEDEDDDEEEEEDDDEDDDDEDRDWAVGDKVSWKYKGKALTGWIASVNKKKELLIINVPNQSRQSVLGFDDETLKMVKKGDKAPDDDEDDDDDDDDEPKKKSKKEDKKSKSKKSKDDDEDEDEDDDIPFDDDDDDDDDDEPKPKKKKKGKK